MVVTSPKYEVHSLQQNSFTVVTLVTHGHDFTETLIQQIAAGSSTVMTWVATLERLDLEQVYNHDRGDLRL